MIYIQKGKEPESWTQRRLTPNAVYEATPDLRSSLLKEQGYICAYCMRRIPVKDGAINATSKIEHVLSRERHPELQMNYNNMVVCCPGKINDGELHCDSSKRENDLLCSPLSVNAMQTIQYNPSDGRIKSSDPNFDKEINDVLNLNTQILMDNRSETWNAVCDFLTSRGWTLTNIRKELNRYQNCNAEGKRIPYCGIVIYFLTKKMRVLEGK